MINEYAELQKELKKLIDKYRDNNNVEEFLIDNELNEDIDSAKELAQTLIKEYNEQEINSDTFEDRVEVYSSLLTAEMKELDSDDVIKFNYYDGAEKLSESELKDYISELKDVIKNGY